MALNCFILNPKTGLSSWLLPAMPEQMAGAEQVNASAQGRVKQMMCNFCLACKSNMKTKFIFSNAFCLLLLFEARVTTKFSDGIIGSYRLHCMLNLHGSFPMSFLVSVS